MADLHPLALASVASPWQQTTCDAECAEVVKQCGETCGKALKKDAPDKVNFCKSKCKEFENECKKDCKADAKK